MIKIEKYENLAFPEKVKDIYFEDFNPAKIEKYIDGFKLQVVGESNMFYNFENVSKPHKIILKGISYEVIVGDITYHLPLPQTIYDFICDMHRLFIGDLYWSGYVYSSMPVKYLLSSDNIEKYYDNLLIKINKDNE